MSIAALAIAFFLVAQAVAAPAARAAPADDLAHLVERRDEDTLRRQPSLAVTRGDRRYLDRYDEDLTEAWHEEGRALNEDYREALGAIDRDALGADDGLTYDILAWELAQDARYHSEGLAEIIRLVPLHHIWGAHLSFAREMQWSSIYPFNTVEDYESAIRRMEGFARWMDQAIENMREGMAAGITLPRLVAAHVLEQVEPLARTAIDESDFLGPVINMPESIPEADRARLAAAYRTALAETVIPAYERMRRFLAGEYVPGARNSIAISAIPQGRELYLRSIEWHTTYSLTPEEIHAIGREEIVGIESEMMEIATAAGFSGTLAEFREFLRSDPQFRFASEEAMKAEFERAKAEVEANLPELFARIPRSPLEIRFLEAYSAPSAAAAYYSPGSPDGRRPGFVYLNSFDLPSRPTYTAEVLFSHEGIPGHHLQLSLAMENENLPEFRRFGGPAAFIEGWGLYAETLGEELGLYTDPYRAFGRLSFEAWRACRLVIDTGIHWFGWTREESIDYLLAHTALTETDAVAEVERYIAIPGQALAYKIGQRTLLSLRQRAREELGARFDIRRFHAAILEDGAMPLPVLEDKIERWIEVEKAN
jgi:uncharacterized protein (DUF885 family)